MVLGIHDASPIGSSFARKDGTIIYANKRLAELFGGTVEEVLATNARNFYVNPDDRDALFARAMPGEQLQNVEVQFKRFDGSGFWGLFSLSHIEPEGEDAYYGSIYDITELNEARQEIEHARDKAAESEARLREAINSISEGFVTFDAEDRLIICNEQYTNRFSLVADKFVPGTLFEEIIDTAISRGHYYLDEDPDDTKRIIGAALM